MSPDWRIALVFVALARPARAEELRPDVVNRAIDNGIAWLKSRQRDDGSWGPCRGGSIYDQPWSDGGECHHTGPTSFALFTLASCGVAKTDPAIRKGLRWLQDAERTERERTSYESSSIILMLVAINRPKGRKSRVAPTRNPFTRPKGSRFTKAEWRWLHKHVSHLIGDEQSCYRAGGLGYYSNGRPGYSDVSATQFALLALREAAAAGYPLERVRKDLWPEAAAYLRVAQRGDGAFGYRSGEPWSAGMTAAGLASLLICKERLAAKAKATPPWLDQAIESAFTHLGRHFGPESNVTARQERGSYHYCYLYAIERVGSLSGRREIGGKDWYWRGAKWLVNQQQKNGAWKDRTCMAPQDVLGTCFALLFLKRATRPAITPRRR